MKILVVEDDPINRQLACELIKSLGHDCQSVADGRDALAEGMDADLVFMDLHLAGGGPSGYDTAMLFLRRNPQCYIVALTAHDGPDYHRYALGCGMREFIAKPLTLQTLAETLANAEKARTAFRQNTDW